MPHASLISYVLAAGALIPSSDKAHDLMLHPVRRPYGSLLLSQKCLHELLYFILKLILEIALFYTYSQMERPKHTEG